MRRFARISIWLSALLVILSISFGKDKKSPTGPTDKTDIDTEFVSIPDLVSKS